MYKRATKTTLVDSSVSTLRPWTSSITCNYIILFNLPRSINRPLSILQIEIFRDGIYSRNWEKATAGKELDRKLIHGPLDDVTKQKQTNKDWQRSLCCHEYKSVFLCCAWRRLSLVHHFEPTWIWHDISPGHQCRKWGSWQGGYKSKINANLLSFLFSSPVRMAALVDMYEFINE